MKHPRLTLVLLLAALLALTAAGCSRSGDDGAAAESVETETGNSGGESEEGRPSREALARGVSTDAGEDESELSPEIWLVQFTYEWSVSPQTGLKVSLGFENPHDTYERARGYVVVVAGSTLSRGTVTGVYPWDVELTDGLPDDYSKGAHLLFRRDQEIAAFIPYENSEGWFDNLRLLIYSEDGEMLRDQSYELDVKGAPTGMQELTTQLDL